MRPIELLHDEGGLVVVDKPAGLEATGRTRDDPGGVEHHLSRLLRQRVWAVHQLDRETTGALIFVRRKPLVAVWTERLRSARKRYLAIVHGSPQAQTVDAALAYDSDLRRWVVSDDGKPAKTAFQTLSSGAEAALVEGRPTTGRTHQIRVHLASIGHPLFGESRHVQPACKRHPRHALHLERIEVMGQVFRSPIPSDLVALASELGLALPEECAQAPHTR